jgi:hypothetical protein
MKTRMSLIFSALLVIMISMVWVVRDPGRAGDVAIAPTMAAPIVTSVPAIEVAVKSPEVATAAVVAPAAAAPATLPPAAAGIAPASSVAALPTDSRTQVHIDKDGVANYTAREGDTVSELAIALMGSDSKAHREAVIAANPSLQKNPDRVLVGDNYVYDSAAGAAQSDGAQSASAVAAGDAVAVGSTAGADTARSESGSDQTGSTVASTAGSTAGTAGETSERKLSYTAQPGDNVAVLAASLLGGDTKANRDAVISGNASLVRDPDRLVAGKTYTITTTSGLVASGQASADAAPTTQPDADDAARMGVGRVLSYVALPGDTLSKLATVLLGSDTQANRQAIMSNNRSLELDPDHLVAGKKYWIAAP